MNKTRRAIFSGALALSLPFVAVACGSSKSDSSAPDTTMSASKNDSSSMTTMPKSGMTDTGMNADKPFGPGCAAVPATGDGSFQGMATAPVATAASANPLLSTLVTAVTKAELVDTLNSTQDITVFAPTNDAFKALDPATLNAALADPKGLLTKVLTNHVVKGRIAPDKLAGEHTTLGGGTITVKGSGENFSIGSAKVICGNVQTANATVYIIDGVLLPQ